MKGSRFSLIRALLPVLLILVLSQIAWAEMVFVNGTTDKGGEKAGQDFTAIYIDSPTSILPNTQYTFNFTVYFVTDISAEWLLTFYVTFPAGYTINSAQDPDYGYQQGWWEHTINGQTVQWVFSNYNYPGAGDIPTGGTLTFSALATTDPSATNQFDCQLSGDEGGSLVRTRYVGAPEVSGISPGDKRTAEIGEDIEIEFTEAVVSASMTYTVSPNPGGLEEVWSAGDTIVTIGHDDFDKGTAYTVSMTAAQDADGYTANPVRWTFYTKADPIDSAFTLYPPLCDGMIVEGEWDNAQEYDISLPGKETTIYLMNDVNNLYIAIDSKSDSTLFYSSFTGTADQFGIYFDEDNNDQWPDEPEQGEYSEEGIYWLLYYGEEIMVNFRGIYGSAFDGSLGLNPDLSTPSGINGGINDAMGNVQYEWAASFRDSFLNCTGDSLGILLFVYNAVNMTTGEYVGRIPEDVYSYNPATFQDVNLEQAPAPEVYSIDPNSGELGHTTEVTISGLYFAEGAVSFIGEYDLLLTNVLDTLTITGVVPSIPEGWYDVIVENPDGQQGVLENGFKMGDPPPLDDDDDTVEDDDSGDDDDDDDDDSCACAMI